MFTINLFYVIQEFMILISLLYLLKDEVKHNKIQTTKEIKIVNKDETFQKLIKN